MRFRQRNGLKIKELCVYQKLSKLGLDHGFFRVPRWIRSDLNVSEVIGAPEKSERK